MERRCNLLQSKRVKPNIEERLASAAIPYRVRRQPASTTGVKSKMPGVPPCHRQSIRRSVAKTYPQRPQRGIGEGSVTKLDEYAKVIRWHLAKLLGQLARNRNQRNR